MLTHLPKIIIGLISLLLIAGFFIVREQNLKWKSNKYKINSSLPSTLKEPSFNLKRDLEPLEGLISHYLALNLLSLEVSLSGRAKGVKLIQDKDIDGLVEKVCIGVIESLSEVYISLLTRYFKDFDKVKDFITEKVYLDILSQCSEYNRKSLLKMKGFKSHEPSDSQATGKESR
jgi:hypothetical protein